MTARPAQPVVVGIVNDYPVIVSGLVAVLAPHTHRVALVSLDVTARSTDGAQVVLFDTFAEPGGGAARLHDLVRHGDARVAVYSWHDSPELVRAAVDAGARGYITKTLGVEELLDAIDDIHSGLEVIRTSTGQASGVGLGEWPGQASGLDPRESEILALITQGMSNAEISTQALIGAESLKKYIRATYRKIGVDRRTDAIRWAVRNGFEVPDANG